MKLIKIGDEYFNVNAIYRIAPMQENITRLYFVADKRIDVTNETLEKILNFAEASNEDIGPNDDAYGAVNSIRTRAGLPILENLTKEQFRDSVLLERRRELCFEGHRWFDLVRTGRLVSTIRAIGNTNIQDYHQVFPVPQLELDLNTNLLPQNDLYN